MGLRVITDDRPVTVYRNDKTTQSGTKYTTYSLGVSSKNMDGNWVTGFIDCQFKKSVDISHKSKITIANAFYTVSEYNGKKYTKIFVMDYKVVEEGEVPPPPANPSDLDNWMSLPEGQEELPFN